MPQQPDSQLLALLLVDRESDVPPFRQLYNAVVRNVSQGSLRPGQRLPTTRALATHLGLALNTVASAYRALEDSGVVEGRGRAGTFVSLGDDPIRAAATKIAVNAVAELRALGLSAAEARGVLADAMGDELS